MCISVFLWQTHPLYPFLLLLNRDEYHNRPTEPLGWWEGGKILGGRDELAGGTWLACSRTGRVAFLTNVREVKSVPEAKSRGDLPVRFLESKKNPVEFAEELVSELNLYNGFNLILTDVGTKTMVYVTNRPVEDKKFVNDVCPGMHVLTNASLDSPWPKAQRLRENFKAISEKYDDSEFPIAEMVDKVMTNTTKDEAIMLPGIYPQEKEHYLSSIFVEAETPLGRYGTRSMSAVSVKTSGEVSFYEKHFEDNQWIEKNLSYKIEETN